MWSHARGLLSPTAIFGGRGTKSDADKREDRAKNLAATRDNGKKKSRRAAKVNSAGLSSGGGTNGEVASQVSHDNQEDEEAAKQIPNALNSNGDGGGGGGGGSSSGYTSQLSGAPASLHQHRRASTTTTDDTGDGMSARLMQNGGDRNNNNLSAGIKQQQTLYQSAAHHTPRPPMVPMMIDDDDDDSDDQAEGDDDEQAIDLDLDDEDLAGDHLSHHHLNHHHNQHQRRSWQLIDGLRQQHEIRYTSGQQHNHLHLQQQQQRQRQSHLDDKLSLANSIMFHDGVSLAPHHHHHHHHKHQQEHLSLPPPTDTTTTSRGTTLLAYRGHDGHSGDCATAIDSDATNLSSDQQQQHHHRHHRHHHHHHHQSDNHSLFHQYSNNNNLLAYRAADLRPHPRGVGKSNSQSYLTNQQQHQNTAIYYQPNHLVNGGQLSNQHHLLAARSSYGARHLRSGSFLQFQSPTKPSPVPPPGSKPSDTLIFHHQTPTNYQHNQEPNLTPSYDNSHQHHHARHSDFLGSNKLASSTTGNQSKKNTSTFKLAGPINAPHQMTNRMHQAHHTNTPRHLQQHQQSNLYLAAPDTSDSSHTSKQQQVRRSRSNQQLSVSPTRAQTTTTRVPRSVSSNTGGAMAGGISGPAALTAANQINANLAAISTSGGGNGGRRSAPPHVIEPPQLVLGCCGKLAKFLLFIANILFWSAGIALGAWGILALVDDHKYNLSQLLVFDTNTRMSLFQLLSWSFITLGCAAILVGVCGCSAMFKNSRWILGLYIFLILAIFALDLATGLLAMIFQERLVANVRLRLVNKLRNEYGLQASFTAAIDYIQTRYECCGLDGHFDYDQSLWRLQRLGGFEATVARTCCHLRNTFDDQAHVNPRPVNESMCQSTDVRFHQSYRYRRGCLDDLERLIRHKIWTFTIGCGIVGAIILLSLALATCFCRSIPSGEDSSSQKLARNGAASRKSSAANRVHQQALAYVENVSKKQGHHSSSHYR